MRGWRRHRPKALVMLLVIFAIAFVMGIIEKNTGTPRSQSSQHKSDGEIIREQAERLDKATR